MDRARVQASVKHPPYHLRPNKAVDRLLFIDILRAFAAVFGVREKDYRYIGFGGPYLEDFKLMADVFPSMRLVSLEADAETFKRQEFHRCSRNLKLIDQTFGSFLETTDLFDRHPAIVWLDYTDFRAERFREIESLGSKLVEPSVLRVTMRASPEDVKGRVERFESECADYLPNGYERKQLHEREPFAQTVCRMIRKAVWGSLSSNRFLPLHQVRYKDSVQMVSVTGVVCEELNERLSAMQQACPHIDPKKLQEIHVPDLTLKERMHLARILPSAHEDGTAVAKKLGYLITRDRREHELQCLQYEKYYQYYPHFSKILP